MNRIESEKEILKTRYPIEVVDFGYIDTEIVEKKKLVKKRLKVEILAVCISESNEIFYRCKIENNYFYKNKKQIKFI